MRQASETMGPLKSEYSTDDGTPVPSGAVTEVTPSRSFTVASYCVFRMRRNWVVGGIPGAHVILAVPPEPVVVSPPEPVVVLPPEPVVLLPPEPVVVPPPEPVVVLPPVPELELPPVPVLCPLMLPVQLAALASRTPARPVRMKCLICALPFCRRHSVTIEQSAQREGGRP